MSLWLNVNVKLSILLDYKVVTMTTQQDPSNCFCNILFLIVYLISNLDIILSLVFHQKRKCFSAYGQILCIVSTIFYVIFVIGCLVFIHYYLHLTSSLNQNVCQQKVIFQITSVRPSSIVIAGYSPRVRGQLLTQFLNQV